MKIKNLLFFLTFVLAFFQGATSICAQDFFRITEDSLAALEKESAEVVPRKYLEILEKLQEEGYQSKEKFLEYIQKKIGKLPTSFQSALLIHSFSMEKYKCQEDDIACTCAPKLLECRNYPKVPVGREKKLTLERQLRKPENLELIPILNIIKNKIVSSFPKYKLSSEAFQNLEIEIFDEEILKTLHRLEEREFKEKKVFRRALEKVLGKENAEKYLPPIVEHAQYQIPIYLDFSKCIPPFCDAIVEIKDRVSEYFGEIPFFLVSEEVAELKLEISTDRKGFLRFKSQPKVRGIRPFQFLPGTKSLTLEEIVEFDVPLGIGMGVLPKGIQKSMVSREKLGNFSGRVLNNPVTDLSFVRADIFCRRHFAKGTIAQLYVFEHALRQNLILGNARSRYEMLALPDEDSKLISDLDFDTFDFGSYLNKMLLFDWVTGIYQEVSRDIFHEKAGFRCIE